MSNKVVSPGQDSSTSLETRFSNPPGSSHPYFVAVPSHGWVSIKFKDLWEYRELLGFLVWRDIKVRYKQAALGIAWAVLQPFLTMVVLNLFFSALGQFDSEGVPYPIFTYSALLIWQLFANSLTASSNSLVLNQGLITKVYFPRLIIPLSAGFVGLVDFLVAFTVLAGMMVYYKIIPTSTVLTLPLFILIALITVFAIGLWLSALNVQYRDVQHVVPFLTQFWFFLTPIAYPISIVPEKWRLLYGLNPMVGVVEGFRWALLNQGKPLDTSIFISIAVMSLLLITGLFYFTRMEKTFADIV